MHDAWETLDNSSSQAGCAILDTVQGAKRSKSGALARRFVTRQCVKIRAFLRRDELFSVSLGIQFILYIKHRNYGVSKSPEVLRLSLSICHAPFFQTSSRKIKYSPSFSEFIESRIV